jgi:hypothetical protein
MHNWMPTVFHSSSSQYRSTGYGAALNIRVADNQQFTINKVASSSHDGPYQRLSL